MNITGNTIHEVCGFLLKATYNNHVECPVKVTLLHPENCVLSHPAILANPFIQFERNLRCLLSYSDALVNFAPPGSGSVPAADVLGATGPITQVSLNRYVETNTAGITAMGGQVDVYVALDLISRVASMAYLIKCAAGAAQIPISIMFSGLHLTAGQKQSIPGLPAPPLDPYMLDADPMSRIFTPFAFCDFETAAQFASELKMFVDEPSALGFRAQFFRKLAAPIMSAKSLFDGGDLNEAAQELKDIAYQCDWSQACLSFVLNRIEGAKKNGSE